MSEMGRVEFGAFISETLASGEKNTVAEIRTAMNHMMDSLLSRVDDTTDDLVEGEANLFHTNERVDDRVAQLLTAGTNITLTYDDVAGTLTISSTGGGGDPEGAVLASAYNAHTILQATSDNTPVPITVAEQTVVGRITGGNIKALSVAELLTLIGVTAGAQPVNSSTIDAAGGVLNSDYNANTILYATSDNTPIPLEVTVSTIVGRASSGAISALAPTSVRTIINVEDGATNNAGFTTVETSTASEDTPNQITVAENGTTYTNQDSPVANFHVLPSDGIGIEYTFMVRDQDGLHIRVGNATHKIRIGDRVTEDGGTIYSDAVGNSITLKRVSSTEWQAKFVVGLWEMSAYVPPEGGGGGTEGEIVEGMCYLWDAKLYTTGQTWANSIVTPADGSAQTASDVYLGNTNSSETRDPTFEGNSFLMVLDDDMFTAKAANPTLIANLHKTQSGTSWTFWMKIKTPEAVATLDTLFSTAANVADRGIKIRSDSGGNLKFDHYDGTTLKTFTAAQKLVANTRYDLFVTYDYAANQVKFSVSSPTFQEITADLTNAITGAATYSNFTLCADADLTSNIEAGARLYGCGFVDHALTNTELAQFLTWSETYYSPEEVSLPAAPTRIISMGAHQKAHFNIVLSTTGGATVTNYAVQKKAFGADDSTYADTAFTFSGLDITATGLTNTTAYTFRMAAITSAGQGPWSEGVSVTPVANGTAPYDLQYYKNTEPVTAAGSRAKVNNVFAREITQPALLTHTSAFFGKADGKLIFKAPNGGATTSNGAAYCRSELRHLTNIANGSSTEDTVKFSVTDIADGEKTIVHQIHGFGADDNPYFKVVFLGKANGTGKVYVLYKLTPTALDSPAVDLKTNVAIGEVVTLRAVFTGTSLTFYVNGSGTGISCPGTFARTTEYYWKRGNYYQSLESSTKPYSVCTVEHYTQTGQYVPP